MQRSFRRAIEALSIEMILHVAFIVIVIGFQIYSLPSGPPLRSPLAQTISFELLGQTKYNVGTNPIFPEKLKASDGKKVTIFGFIAPFNDPQDLSKLLLMPTNGGCYFCAPADAAGVVLVRSSVKEMTWSGGAGVTFEGILHLTQSATADEEAQQFLFTLDEARVVIEN